MELLESSNPWVAAGVTLLVGLIVATAVAALVNAVVRRTLDDTKQAGRVAGGTFWVIVAVALVVAVANLTGEDATTEGLRAASTRLLVGLPNLLAALLLIVFGWVLAALTRLALRRVVLRVQPRAAELLARAAFWAVLALALLLAADQVGVAVGFLQSLLLVVVAGLVAAVALALGLGSRELVSEVVAGRHVAAIVGLGDEIEVAGHRGTVIGFGHASVRLASSEGELELPNRSFLAGAVRIVRRAGE